MWIEHRLQVYAFAKPKKLNALGLKVALMSFSVSINSVKHKMGNTLDLWQVLLHN